jgi:polyisoprenoid-binding protein YceI
VQEKLMFDVIPRPTTRFMLCLSLLMTAVSVRADWILVNEASQLNFVSTKATHIAETHTFSELSGAITEDGAAELVIDLTSVNTGIDIRDQRMQSMLFNVASFPKAQISTRLDLSAVERLSEPTTLIIDAQLSLAGQTAPVEGQVLVVPMDRDRVSITTVAPIIVQASSLGLESGVEALREIAGLPSIGYSVPVTFSLTFTR